MTKATAIVIGHTGGIGAAVFQTLQKSPVFDTVIGLGRNSEPQLDVLREASVQSAAAWAKEQGGDIRLVFDATGGLTIDGRKPEKGLKDIDPDALAMSYALNAIGPALLMKHFLPLLPRDGKAVFATLSARVGSIGDNQLGGWYGYRASKAALNQLVRTAAVEVSRRKPEAICVALHPGTVQTPLTEGFAKSGLDVQSPDVAAGRILTVLDGLTSADTGGYFDHMGKPIPW
ncbi:SDR family NAD(P)-dependent oxidoreductase [Roseibium denhamense]|uniref:NAD(P)-dependent dehydrogenase, short-chain alcohol dehydrogenase family n=1 Tax=Roseibium denhamense TaxID=76305 RepID=A0ABY1PGM1_9HYPH|nr:SDR family NAD(P)-dependent oxidoreductase [Roseibium denhamense]MTI04101.1 SDR family NAD(P)-dependent oxidoreductase [Roseibium denhamense]SMP33634.1 NAD(P)-dependent dehydrogenase, short-chain alcohol dehydrogenase family [Roseibium denhamense]